MNKEALMGKIRIAKKLTDLGRMFNSLAAPKNSWLKRMNYSDTLDFIDKVNPRL